MHPIGNGGPSSNKAENGWIRLGEVRPPVIGLDISAAWSNEAEALLASSDKHFRQDRGSSAGPATLPAVWHPSLEKHWHAVDDGGAELMRAAFGAPAKPAPLRIAGPPEASHPPAELQQSSPRAIQDQQARFQASLVMSLIVFVVLLAAAFTPSIR